MRAATKLNRSNNFPSSIRFWLMLLWATDSGGDSELRLINGLTEETHRHRRTLTRVRLSRWLTGIKQIDCTTSNYHPNACLLPDFLQLENAILSAASTREPTYDGTQFSSLPFFAFRLLNCFSVRPSAVRRH